MTVSVSFAADGSVVFWRAQTILHNATRKRDLAHFCGHFTLNLETLSHSHTECGAHLKGSEKVTTFPDVAILKFNSGLFVREELPRFLSGKHSYIQYGRSFSIPKYECTLLTSVDLQRSFIIPPDTDEKNALHQAREPWGGAGVSLGS